MDDDHVSERTAEEPLVNTPGPTGYLLAVLVSAVLVSVGMGVAWFLEDSSPEATTGGSLGDLSELVFLSGFLVVTLGLWVALPGVAAVHWASRRVRPQWGHVVITAVVGALSVYLAALAFGMNPRDYDKAALGVAFCTSVGRASVIPLVPRWRARHGRAPSPMRTGVSRIDSSVFPSPPTVDRPTPGMTGYLLGLVATTLVLSLGFSFTSPTGGGVASLRVTLLLTTVSLVPSTFAVGSVAVLFLHWTCRGQGRQWVHVLVAGMTGAVLGAAFWWLDRWGIDPYPDAMDVALPFLAAAVGRAVVIPWVPRWRRDHPVLTALVPGGERPRPQDQNEGA